MGGAHLFLLLLFHKAVAAAARAELEGATVREGLKASRKTVHRWCRRSQWRATRPLCSTQLALEGGSPISSPSGGGRIFLLTAFSHDDQTQRPLIPHFMDHYMRQLRILPEHFLLVLHSNTQNVSGLDLLAHELRWRYGVKYTVPAIFPHSSFHHMHMFHHLLHVFAAPEDWIVFVDSDEFVTFPFDLSAPEALEVLDQMQHNIFFGVMVDRLREDGRVTVAPTSERPLPAQYPLTCAVVWMLQTADVRKAVAFKGSLRPFAAGHQVIALNRTVAHLAGTGRRGMRRLLEALEEDLGHQLFAMLPKTPTGELFVGRPALTLATVTHFKWIAGLKEKMERRFFSEAATRQVYSPLRDLCKRGGRFSFQDLETMCIWNNLALLRGAQHYGRPLQAREIFRLFFNTSEVELDSWFVLGEVPHEEEEAYLNRVALHRLTKNIERPQHIPLV